MAKGYFKIWREKYPEKYEQQKKKISEYIKKKRETDPRYSAASYTTQVMRKSKYGLTNEAFETLLKQQNGKCAICLIDIVGIDEKNKVRAHVDHDHVSGKIRGLLCIKCNRGIGLLCDSIENLERAVLYLKE